jgi:hypothetical protein
MWEETQEAEDGSDRAQREQELDQGRTSVTRHPRAEGDPAVDDNAPR